MRYCLFTLLPVILTAACDQQPAQDAAPSSSLNPPFKPAATVQDIMTGIIDPNIDAVWNAVSTVSSATGTEERSPQTDEDWQTLRRQALAVAEAGNLLLIPNRLVAATNAQTASGGAELDPASIQSLIAKNQNEYRQKALDLQTAALGLVTAIDAKNPEQLEEAGGLVEHACEECHSHFWYPGDKRPKN